MIGKNPPISFNSSFADPVNSKTYGNIAQIAVKCSACLICKYADKQIHFERILEVSGGLWQNYWMAGTNCWKSKDNNRL